MRAFLIISIFLLLTGCKEQSSKAYKDYNEGDFIEVQGLIIKVKKELAYQNRKVDITYIYDLDKDKPTIGYEVDSPFISMAGAPVIILVHKYQEGVTFLGGIGYTEDENNIVKRYIEKSERFGVEFYGVD
ncbi:MAG TPA: hypothetical protein VFM69_11265 [Pricia sp.]|nr:hypothetical protein [Pricia sp.]